MATTSLLYLADTPGLNAAQLMSLETISGNSVDLATPQGTTRLVSFWAPDCPISKRDAADLSQLQNLFANDEFEIVAIAMPHAPDAEVQASADDLNYPVAHDSDGSIVKGFPGVRFTPSTFLIDGDGNIVWRHVGKLNATDTARRITDLLQPAQLAKNTL